MKEIRHSSRKQLTVEELLQLKRLERPRPEFWDGFERELKQKQLQALMTPSRWERVRAFFTLPKFAVLAPISAAAIFAAAMMVTFPVDPGIEGGFDLAEIKSPLSGSDLAIAEVAAVNEPVEVAEVGESEAPAPRRTDARFVEDVLRPEVARVAQENFRTVAETETFVGAADRSAYYVVNAFTASPGSLGRGAVTLEF